MAYTADHYRRQGAQLVVERYLMRLDREAYEAGRKLERVELEPEFYDAAKGDMPSIDVFCGDFSDFDVVMKED